MPMNIMEHGFTYGPPPHALSSQQVSILTHSAGVRLKNAVSYTAGFSNIINFKDDINICFEIMYTLKVLCLYVDVDKL